MRYLGSFLDLRSGLLVCCRSAIGRRSTCSSRSRGCCGGIICLLGRRALLGRRLNCLQLQHLFARAALAAVLTSSSRRLPRRQETTLTRTWWWRRFTVNAPATRLTGVDPRHGATGGARLRRARRHSAYRWAPAPVSFASRRRRSTSLSSHPRATAARRGALSLSSAARLSAGSFL